jgi:hypothetical protein
VSEPDPILEPVFRGMDPNHPRHVAAWLAETFGGPTTYTDDLGGYERMLAKHRNRTLTETQPPPSPNMRPVPHWGSAPPSSPTSNGEPESPSWDHPDTAAEGRKRWAQEHAAPTALRLPSQIHNS